MKQVSQEQSGIGSFAEYEKQIKEEFRGRSAIVGIVHVEKFNAQGERVFETWSHNLVTDVGDAWCADRCQATPDDAQMLYMAIGTGATGPLKANTALGAETATSRGAEDSTYPLQGTGANDNDIKHRRTFTGLTVTAVTEVGIFNNGSSGGSMLDRSTFTAVNLTPSDSLQVTVTVTFLGA